jgi:hypothetical protein
MAMSSKNEPEKGQVVALTRLLYFLVNLKPNDRFIFPAIVFIGITLTLGHFNIILIPKYLRIALTLIILLLTTRICAPLINTFPYFIFCNLFPEGNPADYAKYLTGSLFSPCSSCTRKGFMPLDFQDNNVERRCMRHFCRYNPDIPPRELRHFKGREISHGFTDSLMFTVFPRKTRLLSFGRYFVKNWSVTGVQFEEAPDWILKEENGGENKGNGWIIVPSNKKKRWRRLSAQVWSRPSKNGNHSLLAKLNYDLNVWYNELDVPKDRFLVTWDECVKNSLL